MSDKKLKFDLDYEQENYRKVEVQPTKVFDISNAKNNKLENEFLEYSNEELMFKLENEKLSSEKIEAIRRILNSRK